MQGAEPGGPVTPQSPRGKERAFAAGVAFATLLALAAMLGYVAREARDATAIARGAPPQSAPPAAEPTPMPVVEPSVLEAQASIQAAEGRIQQLRDQLALVNERLERQSGATTKLRSQLRALEARTKEHERTPPAVPAKPSPPQVAPAPTDLGPLRERLFTVETAMQTEGTARLDFQTKVEKRIFNLERARDESDAERIKAQQALQERMYNLEQRIQALEERTLAFERKILRAIEELGSR